MEKQEYLGSLEANEKEVLEQFSKVILQQDKSVVETVGRIMGPAPTLNFNEQDVFKYGLAVTSKHISFHSLVMYSNPALMEELKTKLTKVKFQKGCINFKSLEDFPLAVFKEHMKASAKVDFSPMIQHYKSKKK